MVGTSETGRPAGDNAARHEARDVIAAYNQRELRGLLEHVRDGLARLDAGERA